MSGTSTAMNRPGGARTGTAFAVAIGLHVLAVVFIPEFRAGIRSVVSSAGDLVEVEAEEPPPPPPVPEERPAPRPRVVPEQTAPREVTPTNEPPPRQAETTEPPPEIMDNLVLSNSGWSMQQGSGAPDAPIGHGVASDRNVAGADVGVPEGTAQTGPVPAADLSSVAGPPSGLNDALLQRFYPADARQQAVSGRVTIAVDVNADGTIHRTRSVSRADEYGFSDACIRAIRAAGDWAPGRDRSGAAVRSVRNFTCIFDINR